MYICEYVMVAHTTDARPLLLISSGSVRGSPSSGRPFVRLVVRWGRCAVFAPVGRNSDDWSDSIAMRNVYMWRGCAYAKCACTAQKRTDAIVRIVRS